MKQMKKNNRAIVLACSSFVPSSSFSYNTEMNTQDQTDKQIDERFPEDNNNFLLVIITLQELPQGVAGGCPQQGGSCPAMPRETQHQTGGKRTPPANYCRAIHKQHELE